MPIRADLRGLYPPDWSEISHRTRFERAKGRCEACGRPHGRIIVALADGRWLDPAADDGWRTGYDEAIGDPTRIELWTMRTVRVVLTTAHRDHDPSNNADWNLAGWCSRCHILHDAPHHRAQRRITLRSRWALADLFDGPYGLVGYPRNG